MAGRQQPEGAESDPTYSDAESEDSVTHNALTRNTATPNTPTVNTAIPNMATRNTAARNTATRNTPPVNEATHNTATHNISTRNTATRITATRNIATRNTVTRNAPTPNTATRNTVTRNAPTPNTATRNTVTRNTATRNTVTRNTTTPNTAMRTTRRRNTANSGNVRLPAPQTNEEDTQLKRPVVCECAACEHEEPLSITFPPSSPGSTQLEAVPVPAASPPQTNLVDQLGNASSVNHPIQQGTVHSSGTAGTALPGGSTPVGPPSHIPPDNMMLLKDVSMEYLHQLNTLLVPSRTLIRNWTFIANRHGIPYAEIQLLEHSHRHNTLIAMLQLPQFFNYTVGEFKEDMQRFQRLDALEVISK